MGRSIIRLVPVALFVLLVAACGGSDTTVETTATTTTTTSPASDVPAESAPDTSMTDSSEATAPPTTSPSGGGANFPSELKSGTYVVGSEIQVGWWAPDECGCVWAWVAPDGSQTPGTGEDAEVRDGDYAIMLGPCTWTYLG